MTLKEFKDKMNRRFSNFKKILDSEMKSSIYRLKQIMITKNYIRVESGNLLYSIKPIFNRNGNIYSYMLIQDSSKADYGYDQYYKSLRHPEPPTPGIVTKIGQGIKSKYENITKRGVDKSAYWFGYRQFDKIGTNEWNKGIIINTRRYPLRWYERAFNDMGGKEFIKNKIKLLFKEIFMV